MSQDEAAECPLCMETLELDDLSFFPCTCGYQICRFCWHRLRTDENGLCPACRKQYTEDPANFKPLSADEIQQKAKSERRAKKQRLIENRKHLANVRVVQKNLVFVVGLPSRLACPEQLKKQECFGKFGKIHKVVVNQSTSYAGVQGPSASAYVTYIRGEDALRAIQVVNNVTVDGKTLKASLGTTKYCNHFLKGGQCPKADCMYLHELGDEAASFTKEQMQAGKHTEYERRLHQQLNASNNKASQKEAKSFPEQKESPPERIGLQNSPPQHRARHKSECSSEDPSSCDEQKSPLSDDSPDEEIEAPDDSEDDEAATRSSDGELSHAASSRLSTQEATSPIEQQSTSSHSLVNDIELDFDPFYISRKGLADLIEREQHDPPNSSTAHLGGFPFCRMPPRPSPPGMSQRSSGFPPNVINTSIGGGHSSSPMRRAPPPGFGPPPAMGGPSQNLFGPFNQAPSHMSSIAPPYFNQLGPAGDMAFGPYRAFQGSTNPPGIPHRSARGSHDDMLSMKEQQDQLRQLLPSVNISFGPPPTNSALTTPPGLHSLMGSMGGMVGGLSPHGGNGGWPDALHDPAVLSSSRHIQNATTGPAEQRPPFF